MRSPHELPSRAEGAARWRHAGVSPDIAARLASSCNRSTIERRAAHPGYKEAAVLERRTGMIAKAICVGAICTLAMISELIQIVQ